MTGMLSIAITRLQKIPETENSVFQSRRLQHRNGNTFTTDVSISFSRSFLWFGILIIGTWHVQPADKFLKTQSFRKFSRTPSKQSGIFTVAKARRVISNYVRSPVRLISMPDRVVPLKLDHRPNRESNSPFLDSGLILKLLTSLLLDQIESSR